MEYVSSADTQSNIVKNTIYKKIQFKKSIENSVL